MMAKPMKTLELHYPMVQFLIIHIILQPHTPPLSPANADSDTRTNPFKKPALHLTAHYRTERHY